MLYSNSLPLLGLATPLKTSDALILSQIHGKNVPVSSKKSHWSLLLFQAFFQPFNLILMLLAIVSGASAQEASDWFTVYVMSFMITVSTLLKFYQELKAELAAEALYKLVGSTVSVLRLYECPPDRDPTLDDVVKVDSKAIEQLDIMMADIVPGDLVKLSAGDMVPGDVRVLRSKDLYVCESSLTGESIPVEKMAADESFDLDVSQCFMGSSVVSGTAIAIVEKIGRETMFGKLSEELSKKTKMNAFQKGIRSISFLFFGLMVCLLPIVFVLSSLIQKDWFQGFLFSVGVAVGLTPEMLPMIVNSCLAQGSVEMAKKKAIVKKLDGIVSLGQMTVLCTDKTGTLTQNKVEVLEYLDLDGVLSLKALELAYLNSNGQTGWKNLIDSAILDACASFKEDWDVGVLKVDEIPFDFVRRRMSVVLNRGLETLMISKGAVEEMLSVCGSCIVDGNVVPMTSQHSARGLALAESLNKSGCRVVAIGYREFHNQKTFGVKDETQLTLAGFISFLDPPKESARPAIKKLMEYGVSVKVLTGDSPLVCQRVCEEIGLPIDGICTTTDLIGLTDDQVAELASRTTIFAKLNPLQKAQVVKALQANGETVGFLGDGINDAPALKEADVGLSVDEAVDVAKETADIILLEKSLMVLVDGVIQGRKTFGNTIKYIQLALSSNFGNVFSVLVASAWLPFLPMLPFQLVIQNLLYDLSQTVIPFDNIDPEYLLTPPSWNSKSLLTFMLWMGPLSSIFDISTFAFCWTVYDCASNPDGCAAEFQTSWFIEGCLTQTLIVHIIRTAKVPLIQSIADWRLLVSTGLASTAALLISNTEISSLVGMTPPRLIFFPYLVGALLGYIVLTSIVKVVYQRVYRRWF